MNSGLEVKSSSFKAINKDEYLAVRERVGMQDVSHLIKIKISGEDASRLCNYLILTDVSRLPMHQMQPSILLNENGASIADLQIVNFGSHLLVIADSVDKETVINAFNAAKSMFNNVTIEDVDSEIALLSIDGPYSWELLKKFIGLSVIGIRYLEVVPDKAIDNIPVTICRTGKTGEYGYLILVEQGQKAKLWDTLKEAGLPFDLLEYGELAANLFKIENRIINQRIEGSLVNNVFELNTRAMYSRDKNEHIGRDAVLDIIANGVSQRIIGVTFPNVTSPTDFTVDMGHDVTIGENKVGSIVNAGYSYTLGCWIALALIEHRYAAVGVEFCVNGLECRAISAPFIYNKSMNIRLQEDSYFSEV